MKPIGPLDVVALTDDLPEHGLARVQVGTVIEELAPTLTKSNLPTIKGGHTRWRPSRRTS